MYAPRRRRMVETATETRAHVRNIAMESVISMRLPSTDVLDLYCEVEGGVVEWMSRRRKGAVSLSMMPWPNPIALIGQAHIKQRVRVEPFRVGNFGRRGHTDISTVSLLSSHHHHPSSSTWSIQSQLSQPHHPSIILTAFSNVVLVVRSESLCRSPSRGAERRRQKGRQGRGRRT